MIKDLAKANNLGFLYNSPAKAGGNSKNCFVSIAKTGGNSNYLNCPDIYVGNNKKDSRFGFSQNNNSFYYSINSNPSDCKLMEDVI
jgi:hypothetical protein